jgi:uncharacterized protein YjbI with pentapeptide repeats
MIRTPQIFISYSREKFEIAEFLESELTKKKYKVFLDKEAIKIGDSFPKKIENFLKNCDGVIILISNTSIKSEWCRYEYYYSFINNKILIPIITEKLGKGVKNPLSYFQKDINYVHLNGSSVEELNSILSKIEDKLKSVKNLNSKKVVKSIVYTLIFLVLVFLFFNFGLTKINSYSYDQKKKSTLEKIEKSNYIFNSNELEEISNKFNNDKDFAAKLFILSINDKESNYTRLNSKIAIGQVLTNMNFYGKHQITNLTWSNSVAKNNQLTNIVFVKSKIDNVKFDRISFSNTYFSNTVLNNLSFNQCNFSGAFLFPKEASVLNFIGCKFFGCTIEITNFLNVKFSSKLSSEATIVDASMSTFFENCIFESKYKKDNINSLDFNRIKAVKFKEIIFSNCNFKGVIDKDWFEKCSFYNCIFTDISTLEELKRNNFVE